MDVGGIKYLFWNIYKKNLYLEIVSLAIENDIDIIALAETEELDKESLLYELCEKGQTWKCVVVDSKNKLLLLVKNGINAVSLKDEKHYSCYKIEQKDNRFLLFVVHLISGISKEEVARNSRANSLSTIMQMAEADLFENGEYRSIVVGDFNIKPYSAGITGVCGFN